MAAETRPALILGGNFRWALSMVRSLGRRGIPVYVTGTRDHFVSYSRWHRHAPAEWGEPPTPETLCDYLTALPVDDVVLIPPTDEWALAVARLPAPLAARFPSSLAPLDSLDVLIDKGRSAAVLDKLGVPHPRTVRVDPGDGPAHLPPEAFTDAFLKAVRLPGLPPSLRRQGPAFQDPGRGDGPRRSGPGGQPRGAAPGVRAGPADPSLHGGGLRRPHRPRLRPLRPPAPAHAPPGLRRQHLYTQRKFSGAPNHWQANY